MGRFSFHLSPYQIKVLGPFWKRAPFRKRTSTQLESHLERFHELGFSLTEVPVILVGTKSLCLKIFSESKKSLEFYTGSSGVFYDSEIYLRGLVSYERLFSKAGGTPPVLYLRFFTESEHALDQPFILAHELAHLTEPSHLINKSLLWREARANVLASMVSGEKMTIYPEGTQIHGEVLTNHVMAVNLWEPQVNHIQEVIADLRASHLNATLLGSFLFRFGQAFGRDSLVELIHWMDAYAIRTEQDSHYVFMKEGLYSPPSKSQERALILKNFHLIFQGIKTWACTQNNQDLIQWVFARSERLGFGDYFFQRVKRVS